MQHIFARFSIYIYMYSLCLITIFPGFSDSVPLVDYTESFFFSTIFHVVILRQISRVSVEPHNPQETVSLSGR